MEKFLNWNDNKVQNISLDQLTATVREDSVLNDPLRGIYHFDLIQRVLDMCAAHSFNTEVYDLFAAQNRDKDKPGVSLIPYMQNQFGVDAVEAHLLRRVYANIRITDFDADGYTTNLAIAFHQRGIQVGFGNNVIICHNQCMLGADNYVATYSERGRNEKVALEEVFDTIDGWLANAREIIMSERSKIDMMKKIEVTPDKLFDILGKLHEIRVTCDTTHKEIRKVGVYPLNQTQLNKWSERLLIARKRKPLNVWDLYDNATELYKADSADIPTVLPQNRAMAEFLDTEFSL